jgi:Tfp pilus assembly protein PilO
MKAIVKTDLKSQMQLCTRAQWWVALGLLGLIGLVCLLAIRPATARLDGISGYVAKQRNELHSAQARLAALPALEKETEQLRRGVEFFDKRLPKHQDLPQLIGDVTQMSRRAALSKMAWRPEATLRRTDQFTELPLEFTFQGDFLRVINFLSDVQDMQRLTRLRRLDVQAKDGMDGQVDVQLTMNIYFSEE